MAQVYVHIICNILHMATPLLIGKNIGYNEVMNTHSKDQMNIEKFEIIEIVVSNTDNLETINIA